ncbi:hypothetical protein FRC08_013496 [Ceratobasidium sp. 394]|nr:hypothetical protein FRC08_013496 [Ceratobasidium sp. 394]KAG9099004.1 hypothetical protein FS749_002352 [Ceratobasidium sp. UAMH 11750]
MPEPSHPRWGRVVGSYVPPSDMDRLNLSVDSELAGLQAMQEISQLAAEAPRATSARNINISTLESALRLARDPTTIRHLANPPVISGCIQLMKAVAGRSSRVASPFAYEYGYLCFKLLVAALNVCLLERWNKTEQALTMCTRFPNAAAQTPFWMTLATVVDDQFDVLEAGGDCDWVLGWSVPTQHAQQTPLLLRSEVTTLLNLLWDDRKHLLLALMPYTPTASGLSGLFFLLSRFVSRERYPHNNPNWETLKARVYELALRYTLVADKLQREATLRAVDANKIVDTWADTPKHTDAQDSRLMMTAFIHVLSGEDKRLLLTRDPSIMLRLVSLSTDADTQDLLPEVIRLTLEYGWSMLLDLEDDDEVEAFIQCLFGGLYGLIRPLHNRPYTLTSLTQSQIIDVMYDSSLLDLTARSIIRLKPARSPSEAELNQATLVTLTYFFKGLAKAVPERELEICFGDYVPDWWKFNQHLLITEYGVPAAPSASHQKHYDLCMEIWLQIAQYLGLEPAIDEFTRMNCYSGRCPMAYSTIIQGAQFGCGRCAHTLYCDNRCQAMDWKFGGINPPHQQLCSDNLTYVLR